MQENNTNYYYENEIDVKEVFYALWSKKIFITVITTIFAILSVIYALNLPNIFTSTATLAVANEKSTLSSKLGSYSALAGIAGVSLPSDSNNPSAEAIERIKSFDFFTEHFLPYINLEDLYAAKEWNSEEDIIIYDKKLFNKSKNKWVRNEIPSIPSEQEAYEIYQKILSVSEDKKTRFVYISIKYFSPNIAKDWVEIVVKNINESMRSENMRVSSKSIAFLRERAENTNIKEIRDAISQLLQSQMQNLMLATASEDYIYKILNSPIAPEKKSEPGRALICFFGTFIGLLLSCVFALISHYRKIS
jgi:LPS O-antigen subunit length determinant protein (WzzB/FepE family)